MRKENSDGDFLRLDYRQEFLGGDGRHILEQDVGVEENDHDFPYLRIRSSSSTRSACSSVIGGSMPNKVDPIVKTT
jgi:hypothetical protein